MPFITPKIVYGSTTLSPAYAPIGKAMMDDREVLRHDSFSSSGIRQPVVERMDIIRPLQFDFVPWTDLPAWQDFIDYALLGGQFAYYPDATASAFQTFELMDTNFSPKFASFNLSKFSLKLRLVSGGPFSP
jgi:hypothetical protein